MRHSSARTAATALMAAVTLIAALAFPAGGDAVDDPADLLPPTLLTPAEGATVSAGTPIAFRIQTHPDETHSLWLRVSKSPAMDAEGVIGTDAEIETFTAVPGAPGIYEAAPQYFSYSGFWMNTPGVYYWQAYRIHCTTGSSDCRIESPVRTLIVGQRPVTAQIIGVGPTRACYIARTRVHVTATGFSPGAAVVLRFDGRSGGGATADPFGHLDTSVLVPSAGSGPVQRRFRLSVAERNFPNNTASVSLLAANLDFDFSPTVFRRGQAVRIRFSGMPANRAVYAHYRLSGRTRANVRLGLARGACGLLTLRAQPIPARIWQAGRWTVQFDAVRRYSPATNPRLRAGITIRRVG